VVSFALVYLTLVENGLQTSGIGGFLLSLFPPFLFFSIGLIIQRKYIKKTSKTGEEEKLKEVVSAGLGNVTKMAEYQQSEMEQSILAKGNKSRAALSVQFNLETAADGRESDEKVKLTYNSIE